jgi:thiosulfate/3-mercaptopyruvate sulfurtransferase
MNADNLPLLIEPDQLETILNQDDILVVDLSKASTYAQLHIPGAVHLEYSSLAAEQKPAQGLLPPVQHLEKLFSDHGIGNNTHVIAYDDEGGGKAARLLWTLEVMGHQRFSLLNGGLHAWANERHPLANTGTIPSPVIFKGTLNTDPVATTDYILDNLDNPDVVLLDARSVDEFSGARRFANRGGHIPGAVNMDWILAMDQGENLRMRPAEELLAHLASKKVTPDKEIVTYCQTHHRSSYSYIMLKILGFTNIKGYPGSWSDWGNRADTPIE